MLMGLDGQLRKKLTYGDEEPKTVRICFAYKIRSTTMGYGKHAPTFNMSEIYDGLQIHDCNGKGPPCMAELHNKIGGDKTFQLCYPHFKISKIPRELYPISDSLPKTVRSFHRELCFTGYFLLIWLLKPSQI